MPDARTRLYDPSGKLCVFHSTLYFIPVPSYCIPVLQVALVVSRWAALVIFCSVWSGPCSFRFPCLRQWSALRSWNFGSAFEPFGATCAHCKVPWLMAPLVTAALHSAWYGLIHEWRVIKHEWLVEVFIENLQHRGARSHFQPLNSSLTSCPSGAFLFSAFKTLMGFSLSTIFQLHERTNMPFNMHQWIPISRCLWPRHATMRCTGHDKVSVAWQLQGTRRASRSSDWLLMPQRFLHSAVFSFGGKLQSSPVSKEHIMWDWMVVLVFFARLLDFTLASSRAHTKTQRWVAEGRQNAQ